MSSAPSTEASWRSRFFNAKKRPADAEMRGATGNAVADIEYIALDAFVTIDNRRNTGRERVLLDQKTIAAAAVKITAILNTLSRDDVRDAMLIDRAIWGLMVMVSKRGDSSDAAAAYVMWALLFPLKCDTMRHDCESLLYKTVRYSDFKFGRAVFAAVVSRNDQLFRAKELRDVGAIHLFEERYNAKLGGWAIAEP